MIEHVVGDFHSHSSGLPQSIDLCFNFTGTSNQSACSKQKNWYKNHISACFIADYAGQVVTDRDPSAEHWAQTVSDTVNYVANELLEDAMLRRESDDQAEIKINVRIGKNHVALYVTNPVRAECLNTLTHQLDELIKGDPTNRYLQQLQHCRNDDLADASDLRYLSMMVDHEVNLAWKIVHTGTQASPAYVTTMTSVPLRMNAWATAQA